MVSIIALIINVICMTICISNVIHTFKTDKEMTKMFKSVDKHYYSRLKACILDLTPDEALELIYEVVDIPDKFYLGINSEDILEIILYESDNRNPKKMGKEIQRFYLDSYKSNELISFGIEILNYIGDMDYEDRI